MHRLQAPPLEVCPVRGSPHRVRRIPAGQMLYHGTDCAGDFLLPDGPAWFSRWYWFAATMAGWRPPPPGRSRGPRRVLKARLSRDIVLRDFGDSWFNPDSEEIAGLADTPGIDGWYARTEVLLLDPATSLIHAAWRSMTKRSGS